MENTDYLDHFLKILSPIFPPNSEIEPLGELNETIQISWPTPEPERPHKRSRPLHIVFSPDLLSDYDGLGPISRKRFDTRLINYIQHKLEKFNPIHDTYYSTPNPEKWVVPLALFG